MRSEAATVLHKRTNPAREIVDWLLLLRIAVAAEASPKTVDRVLLGLRVRGQVARRIVRTLFECGIVPRSPEPGTGNGGEP